MFAPEKIQEFRFSTRSFDSETGELRLGYALSPGYEFLECYTFPAPGRALGRGERELLDRLVFFLHLAAGVSYFKAAIPPRMLIESGGLSEQGANFFSELYLHGLGEFAYRNSLSLNGRCSFEANALSATESRPYDPAQRKLLIPLGGGKDSLVSLEMVRTLGHPLGGFVLGDFPLIERVAEVAQVPLVKVERRLDPLLFQLNREGAYNGHVPISAIFSLTACIAAVLGGYSEVVASQERSASSGNVLYEGREVNHQYSKSLPFERGLARLLREEVSPGLRYYSLLRPLSEVHISKIFAGLKQYHFEFTSCNRAFHLSGSKIAEAGRGLWCGDCPKCRFVFLALAPFLEKGVLLEIFAKNMLADPLQERGFLDILGLGSMKPFECVGEFDEAQWCLAALGKREDWRSDLLVERLSGALSLPDSEAEIFSFGSEHELSAEMESLVRGFASTER